MYQNEKEEAKRLQSARKLREDEGRACKQLKNMSNWRDWEEARSKGGNEWRLEPEGEAEVPEIIVVTDAVASTFVDLDGGSRPEQVEARLSRREREKHWAKGVRKLKSHRRKVIWVESEETQDYVRKAKSAEQEEMEERSFIPSAVSVPQKPFVSL